MKYKDYYAIMGVTREANADEIKRAYRKLARKYHPDVSKEANAEAKFKELGEAYEVLRDPQKREAYNQLGEQWREGQDFQPPPHSGGNYQGNFTDFDPQQFSDFFSEIFGRAHGQQAHSGKSHHSSYHAQGENLHHKVTVTLEDVLQGATKEIQLVDPHHHKPVRALKVKIPQGVRADQQLRLKGQGMPGYNGAPSGDLFLEINIAPHRLYTWKKGDLYLTLPIAPWEAALGASIEIPTLTRGKIQVKVPPNSQSGQNLRLKGLGFPGKNPGDLYIILKIVNPPAETESAKNLFAEMASTMTFNPRELLGA